MKLHPRQRWMLLAALLTLTVSAAAWVSDTGKPETEIVEAPARGNRTVTTATQKKDPTSIHLQKLQSRNAGSRTDDAFPPHSWRKPAPAAPVPVAQPVITTPPPAPVVVAAAPPPPPPPPPPKAPPLPFLYLGKIESEEANAIFLGLGDRNLIIHAGDTIDGLYHVDVVSEAGVTFTHLPTGNQQNLAIGAPK